MSQYKKLTYNTFFMLVGNIGTKMLGFILLPFYTKFLNPQIYGELNLITALISFVTPILTLELSGAMFRLSSGKDEREQNKYLITGILYTLPIIFICFSFLNLVSKLLNQNYIQKYFITLLLTFIFNFINGMIREKLRCNSEIKLYTLIGMMETVLIITLNIFLVPRYFLFGMLLSSLIGSFCIMNFLLLKIKFFSLINSENLSKKLYKEMLMYSFPLIPNAVIWWVMGLSDRFFIKYYHNFELVGLYSVANKYSLLITTLFGIFYKSLQISALEEFKTKNYPKFFKDVFFSISDLMIVSSMFLIYFIKFIVEISVSKEYFVVWQYVPLLLVVTLFNSYSAILGVNYLVNKNSKGVLKSSLIATVVNICFNFILIPKYKIFGAIIATILAYLTLFIIRIIESRKNVKIQIDFEFIISNLLPIFMLVVLLNKKNEYLYNTFILFLLFFIKRKKIINYIKIINCKIRSISKKIIKIQN